jgi:peptidoglycan hydrolase CwlO-like protein
MLSIKVLVKSIDNEQIKLILDYYNSKKSPLDEPLEHLDRCEGGFQIQISYMKNQFCDINNKIKQLRWKNGQLVSKIGSQSYICFTENELKLLYESLVHVLGKNNVVIL